MVDGDGQHAGYGPSKGDGPASGSEHRALGRSREVGTVMTAVSPFWTIGRDHRSGHGSPQAQRQQKPGHHPSFYESTQRIGD